MKLKESTDIPPSVRERVYTRDSFDGWVCCAICGKPATGEFFSNGVHYYSGIEQHHFISRGRGGMGIEENLICLCPLCHKNVHSGIIANDYIKSYLSVRYPNWDEKKLIKRK